MADELKGSWHFRTGHHHMGGSSFLSDGSVNVDAYSTDDFTFSLPIGANNVSFKATQKKSGTEVVGFTFSFETGGGEPATRIVYSGAARVHRITLGNTTYTFITGTVIRGAHIKPGSNGDEDMGTFMAVKNP